MKVEPIYLTWLNYLGGFEYFLFTAEKDYNVDIIDSATSRKNVLSGWSGSWGSTADTIDRKTYTIAKRSILVRSQHLTANQRDALAFIKVSPVVQIVNSRTDRRTVLVDTNSYKVYGEPDKLFTTSFTITFTDEIPAQRL